LNAGIADSAQINHSRAVLLTMSACRDRLQMGGSTCAFHA